MLLPLAQAAIQTFQHYSYPQQIAGAVCDTRGFILSHHGNLCFVKSFHKHLWDPFDFLPGPQALQWQAAGLLGFERLDLWRDLRGERVDVAEFVIERIEQGCYCLPMFDCLHLPGRGEYRRKRYMHQFLAHGLDRKRGEVALTGYFGNARGEYSTVWIPLRQFKKALSFDIRRMDTDPTSNNGKIGIWETDYLVVYRPNPDARFEFDPTLVALELECYLESRCHPRQLAAHSRSFGDLAVAFGIDVYPVWLDFIALMESGAWPIDRSPVRLFWEHKSLMLDKARLVEELGIAQLGEETMAGLKKILSLARKFSLQFLDPKLPGDAARFEAIRQTLAQCKELEAIHYERFLNAFSRSGIRPAR